MKHQKIILRGALMIGILTSLILTQYMNYLASRNMQSETGDRDIPLQWKSVKTNSSSHKSSIYFERNMAKASLMASHTTQLQPHPHAGARYANGSWGYVADVTEVRRFVTARYHHFLHHPHGIHSEQRPGMNTFSLESHLYLRDMREMESTCQAAPREGKERKAGWRLLTRRVQVNASDPQPVDGSILKQSLKRYNTEPSDTVTILNDENLTIHSALDEPLRILCAVYSYEKRQEMATTVAETWGWKCDGFFVASTQTVTNEFLVNHDENGDDSQFYNQGNALGSVDLPHLGPESYTNMWQKTRSILSYMHDHYLEKFDFFFLSGDDTYVIVENLRRTLHYLGQAAFDDPLYLGHWVPYGSSGSYYCGGGPGYVLNRKTLKLLVSKVFPVCQSDVQDSSEDRILGHCLRSIVGVVGNHSVDAANAQRFHGMDPHDTCTMKGESGFFGRLYRFWGKQYGGFKMGFNLTSPQSVSFHNLRTSRHLKRIHAILYKSCPPNTTLGDLDF